MHIHRNPRSEIYENFRNFKEISSNTIMNVYISILTLVQKYMKILEISLKFQRSVIKYNNEYIHIHPNRRPEIYENFKEISERFRGFQGNSIKHNNECIHIHPNPRSEIYENFRNFSEISEIITSSDTWDLG